MCEKIDFPNETPGAASEPKPTRGPPARLRYYPLRGTKSPRPFRAWAAGFLRGGVSPWRRGRQARSRCPALCGARLAGGGVPGAAGAPHASPAARDRCADPRGSRVARPGAASRSRRRRREERSLRELGGGPPRSPTAWAALKPARASLAWPFSVRSPGIAPACPPTLSSGPVGNQNRSAPCARRAAGSASGSKPRPGRNRGPRDV